MSTLLLQPAKLPRASVVAAWFAAALALLSAAFVFERLAARQLTQLQREVHDHADLRRLHLKFVDALAGANLADRPGDREGHLLGLGRDCTGLATAARTLAVADGSLLADLCDQAGSYVAAARADDVPRMQAIGNALQHRASQLGLAIAGDDAALMRRHEDLEHTLEDWGIVSFVLAVACLLLGFGAALRLHWQRNALMVGLEGEVAHRTADLTAAVQRYERVMRFSSTAKLLCGADRALRYANPAALALLARLDRRAAPGTPLTSLLAPQGDAELDAALDLLWRAPIELPFARIVLGTDADGQVIVAELAAASWSDDDGAGLQAQIVLHDVSALARKEAETRAINQRLTDLSSQLLMAREDERRRIARDLHDDVGQILTALRLRLKSADHGAGGTLKEALRLTDDALRHTRELTTALHPHVLDELGLEAAVSSLAQRFVRPAVQTVRLSFMIDPPRAAPSLELAAYRVLQEALTNVVRHAQARSVEVEVEVGTGWLRIEVRDDGCGWSPRGSSADSLAKGSLGLASMRERVRDLRGEFDITGRPGQGTRLRALLPWPDLPLSLDRKEVADARAFG